MIQIRDQWTRIHTLILMVLSPTTIEVKVELEIAITDELLRKWEGSEVLGFHCGSPAVFIDIGEAFLIISPAAVARM
jgi:hypothetical protein